MAGLAMAVRPHGRPCTLGLGSTEKDVRRDPVPRQGSLRNRW